MDKTCDHPKNRQLVRTTLTEASTNDIRAKLKTYKYNEKEPFEILSDFTYVICLKCGTRLL